MRFSRGSIPDLRGAPCKPPKNRDLRFGTDPPGGGRQGRRIPPLYFGNSWSESRTFGEERRDGPDQNPPTARFVGNLVPNEESPLRGKPAQYSLEADMGESRPETVSMSGFGGGGGNRTPVPKSFQCGFYEHSPSFDLTFRAPGTGSRTARPLFGSPCRPWPRLRGYPALWPPALTSREEGLAEGLLIRQPERSYRSQLKVFPGV